MLNALDLMRSLALGLAIVFLTGVAAQAQEQRRAPEIYLDNGGVFSKAWDYAVDGYDVVAYYSLEEGAAPIAGDDAYIAEYKGAKWRFSSQQNLDAFQENPERYSPAYGGYCAWAMARGQLAKGDPKAWYVHGGKLYLNVNARIQRRWLSDLENEIARANANWPGALEEA